MTGDGEEMAVIYGVAVGTVESGDSSDTVSANAATEVSLAEPIAGLVSRLLTGLAETIYMYVVHVRHRVEARGPSE